MSHNNEQDIRECDPYFLPEECLYRRINPEWYDVDQQQPLDLMAAPLPHFSVNREKYSNSPKDVLRLKPTWRIGEIKVLDLPSLTEPEGTYFAFKPIDDPVQDNKAHALVCLFKNCEEVGREKRLRGERKKVKTASAKELRLLLLSKIKILPQQPKPSHHAKEIS